MKSLMFILALVLFLALSVHGSIYQYRYFSDAKCTTTPYLTRYWNYDSCEPVANNCTFGGESRTCLSKLPEITPSSNTISIYSFNFGSCYGWNDVYTFATDKCIPYSMESGSIIKYQSMKTDGCDKITYYYGTDCTREGKTTTISGTNLSFQIARNYHFMC
ncbi:predicted protein [Naegleria gruberi]|uniref:Predicted protein n=1 Tax=Naegleria gruberi TaxID=5762 RepID=D2VTP5_NAEGR|nr:uncharacterized protein NAEGRDRAFT_72375 [Naegleria gruberi]EFC39690.1 predicted protein [Naegleria gruberi]|eukprot:XP_002672434.1 predicted protein [Naegleria gruberi strain NEG-M]